MDLNNLISIDRIRIPETRDYINGYLMNRNERVVPWPKETISKMLETIHPNEWNMYHNVESLYGKISNYTGVSTDQIVVVNGAEDGINRCYQVFVREGTHVGYLYPTYAMYYVYTDAYKAIHHRYGYDIDKHNVKLQKQKIMNDIPNLNILFLANPNHFLDNLTKKDIEQICTLAQKHNVVVVLDEVAGGFGAYRSKELINKYDNLLVINSFSKEFGLPTIRTGWLMGSKRLIKACTTLRISYEISMPSQKFAEYLMDNLDIKTKYCQEVVAGREYCVKELEKIGVKCNNDNAVYFNPYFENIKQKEYVIFKLQEDKIYVKNYRKDMYNGRFEHFITVAAAPKHIMDHFLNKFKKAYAEFNKNSIVKNKNSYGALYYESNNNKIPKDFLFQDDNNGKLKYVANDGTFDNIYKNISDPWSQSDKTDKFQIKMRDQLNHIVGKIKKTHDNMTILDVGCGNGYSTQYLKNYLGDDVIIHGSDISQTAIKIAKERYGNNIYFYVHSIKRKSDMKYDVIILSNLLWYVLTDLNETLNNVFDMLNENGKLIIFQTYVQNQKYAKDVIDGYDGMKQYLKKNFPNNNLIMESMSEISKQDYRYYGICVLSN